MRLRFRSFGYALCGSLALLLSGCGSAALGKASAAPAIAPAPPGAPGAAIAPTELAKEEGGAEMPSAAATASDPAPAAPSGATAAPRPGSSVVGPSREMLDIEANVEIRVTSVK